MVNSNSAEPEQVVHRNGIKAYINNQMAKLQLSQSTTNRRNSIYTVDSNIIAIPLPGTTQKERIDTIYLAGIPIQNSQRALGKRQPHPPNQFLEIA